jgi:predicted RNA-binding Zn ribbon-like protein
MILQARQLDSRLTAPMFRDVIVLKRCLSEKCCAFPVHNSRLAVLYRNPLYASFKVTPPTYDLEDAMTAPCFSYSDHDSVLAFLNTSRPGIGCFVDELDTDEGVMIWLQNAGYMKHAGVIGHPSGELSLKARQLRELIRELVTQRKMGIAVEVNRLNEVLAHGSYQTELGFDAAGQIHLHRRYAAGSPEQILTPVAVAAADLLARADFRLIRKCEGDDCPLWFHDRTKAHKRRWCNMAVCGNREKAARFRDRLNAE